MAVKFGIKGCWYPRTPRTEWSSLRFHRFQGQSLITVTLAGSIMIPSQVSRRPRKSISLTSNKHFWGWRKREISYKMSKNSFVIS